MRHPRPSPLEPHAAPDAAVIGTSDGSAGHMPDLMILGAQKAATSSIFDMLKAAGLVCGTHHEEDKEKEAHFFDFYTVGYEKYGKDNAAKLRTYMALFTTPGCEHYVDATPSYLADYTAPARMADVMPQNWMKGVRMLAILREPVSRDLSEYNMLKEHWWKNGRRDMSTFGGVDLYRGKGAVLCNVQHVDAHNNSIFQSYAEAIGCKADHWMANCAGDGDKMLTKFHTRGCSHRDLPPGGSSDYSGEELGNRLSNGMYYPQVHNYLNYFAREQLMVVNFDEMLSRPKIHITAIIRHFGVKNGPHHHVASIPHTNEETFAGKVLSIQCDTAKLLDKVYGPFNTRLYHLLNTSGAPPEEEPAFTPFAPVRCGEQEVTAGETPHPVPASGAPLASSAPARR